MLAAEAGGGDDGGQRRLAEVVLPGQQQVVQCLPFLLAQCQQFLAQGIAFVEQAVVGSADRRPQAMARQQPGILRGVEPEVLRQAAAAIALGPDDLCQPGRIGFGLDLQTQRYLAHCEALAAGRQPSAELVPSEQPLMFGASAGRRPWHGNQALMPTRSKSTM